MTNIVSTLTETLRQQRTQNVQCHVQGTSSHIGEVASTNVRGRRPVVEPTSSLSVATTYQRIASWIEHITVGELSTTVFATRRSNGRKTASAELVDVAEVVLSIGKMRTAAVVVLAVNYDRRQLRSPYRSRVLPRRSVTRLGVYSKAVSLTRESDAVANFSVEVDGGGRPTSVQRMIATYRSVSTRSKCTANVLQVVEASVNTL